MTDRLKVGGEIGVASHLNVTFTQMDRYGFAQSKRGKIIIQNRRPEDSRLLATPDRGLEVLINAICSSVPSIDGGVCPFLQPAYIIGCLRAERKQRAPS